MVDEGMDGRIASCSLDNPWTFVNRDHTSIPDLVRDVRLALLALFGFPDSVLRRVNSANICDQTPPTKFNLVPCFHRAQYPGFLPLLQSPLAEPINALIAKWRRARRPRRLYEATLFWTCQPRQTLARTLLHPSSNQPTSPQHSKKSPSSISRWFKRTFQSSWTSYSTRQRTSGSCSSQTFRDSSKGSRIKCSVKVIK